MPRLPPYYRGYDHRPKSPHRPNREEFHYRFFQGSAQPCRRALRQLPFFLRTYFFGQIFRPLWLECVKLINNERISIFSCFFSPGDGCHAG